MESHDQNGDSGFFTLEAIIALAIAALAITAYYDASAIAVRGRAKAASSEALLAIGLSELNKPLDSSKSRNGNAQPNLTWSILQKPIKTKGTTATTNQAPVLVVFEAKDSAGRLALELRTIKLPSYAQ